jgi:uncharacterized damage-inducible protein DinB
MKPAATVDRLFTEFSCRKLRQLTACIRGCAAPLTAEQLWRRAAEDQNAAGNILLHLAGNVRQWIVSGVGGAPDIRVREREFSTRGGADAAELLARLEATMEEAVTAIERLTAERLAERVTIQGYDVTVLEAVYHVVEHFSQHAGQVIVLSRQATGASPGFYRHLEQQGGHGEKTP